MLREISICRLKMQFSAASCEYQEFIADAEKFWIEAYTIPRYGRHLEPFGNFSLPDPAYIKDDDTVIT
jgi:hypothetical protein